MTRRIVTELPELQEVCEFGGYYFTYRDKRKGFQRISLSQALSTCRYGKPNDRLWTREKFRFADEYHIQYAADNFIGFMKNDPISRALYVALHKGSSTWLKWRPPMYMPRFACRSIDEIVNIKLERLQDISEEDAIKEGIYLLNVEGGGYKFDRGEQEFDTAKEAFADLWDSINAKKGFGWDVNPWVWCIEFRRVE